jgi:hypothetical protein
MMTEACAGRERDFADVRWYRVPGSAVMLNGEPVSSYWSREGRFIVVPDSLADAGSLVRHEMLHDILDNAGHPRDGFLDSCAGIVSCYEGCADDARPWTAPAAFSILTSEVLSLEASPQLEPKERDGDQWFTLKVDAHNATGGSILVNASPWIGFGYTAQLMGKGGRSSSFPIADSSMLYFAPNETKHWLFEWRIADAFTKYTLERGDYQFVGGFGGHWTPPMSFTIPEPAQSVRR